MNRDSRTLDRWSAALLALYPSAWRARYGAEMADIVGREGLTVWGVLDLLRGALDAHLHLPALLKGWSSMERLTRRKIVLVLFAAGLFAKSAMGLLETRDAVSFAASPARVAGQVTADLVWLAMALAGLACLAGAGLAAAGALRFMRDQHRYRALRYLALPPLAALVALGSGWGLGRLAQGHLELGLGRGLFVGWNVLVSLCGLLCVYAAWRLLGAVELPERLWRLLDRLAGLVIASLAVGAAALVAYLVALAGLDSSLLSAHDGLFATSLLPTLLAIVAGGLAAGALAIVASRQGQTGPRPSR